MLTRFEFKQSQYRPGGCNQVRVTTNPLDRQADVGTVFIRSGLKKLNVSKVAFLIFRKSQQLKHK